MYEDLVQALLDKDNSQTQAEMGDQLGVSPNTILRNLHAMKMIKKFGLWIPQQLDRRQLENRRTTCEMMLARFRKRPFLDRIVTGERKWVKLSGSNLKIWLWVWWDQYGIIYYEFLQPNEIDNTDRYHQQMINLSTALEDHRPQVTDENDSVILLHGSAKLKLVQETIDSLGWETLLYDAYSPDLSPSQYLFAHLKKRFNSNEHMRKYVDRWSKSPDTNLFSFHINNLVENWQKCVNKNGDYIF